MNNAAIMELLEEEIKVALQKANTVLKQMDDDEYSVVFYANADGYGSYSIHRNIEDKIVVSSHCFDVDRGEWNRVEFPTIPEEALA